MTWPPLQLHKVQPVVTGVLGETNRDKILSLLETSLIPNTGIGYDSLGWGEGPVAVMNIWVL